MQRRDVLISAVSGSAVVAGGARAYPEPKSPRTIDSRDGVRLFYRDWGAGKPVLFVHSWALDHTIWNYQVQFLGAHGLRSIAFDWRGHGRSDTPSTGYEVNALADDIAAVVESLDLHDVILVGHSMGCGYIVRYLARHGSSRVSKLVLVAPALPFALKTDDNPHGAPMAYFEGLRAAWADDFPKWIEDNKRPFFTPETPPAMMDWIADLMRDAYLPAITSCQQHYVGIDFRPDAIAVDRPTLILQGDKDVSAPPDVTGRRAAALIPNSILKIYAGAAHGVFLTHHKQVNQDILSFITS